MTTGALRRIAALGVLALAIWPISVRAEQDALLATVNRPATLTVAGHGDETTIASKTATTRPSHVIISITGYRPSDDCTPLEIVVKGRIDDGAELEVGRFGITPDRAFDAAEPSKARRFNLPLPSELATRKPVALSVHLVPVREGKSADVPCATRNAQAKPGGGPSLRVGGAVIR